MELNYQLRFPESDLRKYEKLYDVKSKYDPRLEKYHVLAPKQGHLTIDQLFDIADWKAKRSAVHVWKNSEDLVIELTAFAFSAKNPAARIGALTLLSGVEYPTASVISHFCIDRNDPIIDERALWSLSLDKPNRYVYSYWEQYVAICRGLAERNNMTVREIDKALWKYSEMYQGGLSASKRQQRRT